MFHVPDDYRIRTGQLASTDEYANNGAFALAYKRVSDGRENGLLCIASDGADWEHVSISTGKPRCPYWVEMCFIKDIFWDEDDAVIQIHPPAAEYVNHHPYTLHLWRKVGTNDFFDMPDSILVGPKP
jgi:hypothetical protein